jgi:glycosyltransferase involved in cell wall biosynthesis
MISIVVPLFDERASLATLVSELSHACEPLGAVEFVFVDDGSRDGSWDELRRLAADEPRLRAVRFRRNFGKSAALAAGFQAARGRVLVTLDADLQDDPAEIGHLLAKLDEGFDVVSGWKRVRHDPWHKVWPSRLFNSVVSQITGCRLHDHNCGIKAIRREVTQEIELYGERHRFIPALAASRGFRVGEVVVNHRRRAHGHSKFGASRLLKGFLDLITVRFLTRFAQRPMHLLGTLGLLLFALGGAGLLAVAFAKFSSHTAFSADLWLILSALAVGLGVQFLCLGVIAELLTSYQARSQQSYSVVERMEPGATGLAINLETGHPIATEPSND